MEKISLQEMVGGALQEQFEKSLRKIKAYLEAALEGMDGYIVIS